MFLAHILVHNYMCKRSGRDLLLLVCLAVFDIELCILFGVGELKLGYLKKPYLVTMTTLQMIVMMAFETVNQHSMR